MALSHVWVIFMELDLLAFGLFKEIKDGCPVDLAKGSHVEEADVLV